VGILVENDPLTVIGRGFAVAFIAWLGLWVSFVFLGG
jgi:hypothetical protein